MSEGHNPGNTIVSVEHNNGTIFLVGGHVAGTAEGRAWEQAGKNDIDPHAIMRARDWKPSEVTLLSGNVGNALEQLVDTEQAGTLEAAAELYYRLHPQAFTPDDRA